MSRDPLKAAWGYDFRPQAEFTYLQTPARPGDSPLQKAEARVVQARRFLHDARYDQRMWVDERRRMNVQVRNHPMPAMVSGDSKRLRKAWDREKAAMNRRIAKAIADAQREIEIQEKLVIREKQHKEFMETSSGDS